MKNIKEIMSEMTGLSKQIAVTLNNEDSVTEDILPQVSCQRPSCDTTTTTCDPTDNTVAFCCAINFPNTFHFNSNNPGTRILYDLNCLNVIIVPCCCAGVPRYDIKIVGCIPFITNISVVAGQSGQCVYPPNSPIFLSCHSSVCVDNIVCNKCTYEEAIIAREIVKNKLKNCSCITVTLNPPVRDNCVVKVTGQFILPNCNQPTTGNCNPS
ncbi:hypothetical protein ACOT7R_14655 [Clostridium perfringens]|uniref:hypothetical protein n=1 Tax=Clostridium perfringens TaxID=1502 RepID=UPI003BAC5148